MLTPRNVSVMRLLHFLWSPGLRLDSCWCPCLVTVLPLKWKQHFRAFVWLLSPPLQPQCLGHAWCPRGARPSTQMRDKHRTGPSNRNTPVEEADSLGEPLAEPKPFPASACHSPGTRSLRLGHWWLRPGRGPVGSAPEPGPRPPAASGRRTAGRPSPPSLRGTGMGSGEHGG